MEELFNKLNAKFTAYNWNKNSPIALNETAEQIKAEIIDLLSIPVEKPVILQGGKRRKMTKLEELKDGLETAFYNKMGAQYSYTENFEEIWQYVLEHFEPKQKIKVEPDVIVNFAEVISIIDEMIDEMRKGYYYISDTIDLAQYDKGYIKALEKLKSKISA